MEGEKVQAHKETSACRIKQVVFAIDALDHSSETDAVAYLLNALSLHEMRLLMLLYGSDPDGWERGLYKRLLALCFLPPALLSVIIILVGFIPALDAAVRALPSIGYFTASSLVTMPFLVTMAWGTFWFFYAHNRIIPRKRQEYVNRAFGEDTQHWPTTGPNAKRNAERTFALIRDCQYIGVLLEMSGSLFCFSPKAALERLLWQIDATNIPPLTEANMHRLKFLYDWGNRSIASLQEIALRDAIGSAAAILQDEKLNGTIRQ